ncbi:hypothetical protein [Kitasatospora sp. NPDC002040]|uniref:hypothetical protein n=1 Tax=Kitasatospora sp. NPDC002040 TaxID=3154661 RepID=UPI003330F80B
MRTLIKTVAAVAVACSFAIIPTTASAENGAAQNGSGNVAVGQSSEANGGGTSSNNSTVSSITATGSNVGNHGPAWWPFPVG